MPIEITHRNLCDIAVKWLKRPNSNGGHGCHVAVSEVASGWNGEIPDAIGFRATGDHSDGSVVVEVKVSRNDFLSDKKKPHRSGETLGMGNWRYYMCPTDLIKPDELPDKFGLLYVNNRGHVKPVVTPFLNRNWNVLTDTLAAMRFTADVSREAFLMIRLLSRVGDPEKRNNDLKDARNGRAYYEKNYRELSTKYNELYTENVRHKRKTEKLDVIARNGKVKQIEV